MFKRILVPLDGSELAEKALPYAEELARHFGSEVTLLNVMTPTENRDKPEYRAYLTKIAAATEQNLKKSPDLLTGIKTKVATGIVESEGSSTNPAEHILNYAEKENDSIIVMATHGRTGIRRWALGSTANNVARAFKSPLLLVRAGTDVPKSLHLSKILVPLDGSKPSEEVLPYIENIAAKLKSSIYLLNVVELLYNVYASPSTTGYYAGEGFVRVPYNEQEMKPFKEAAEKYTKSVSDKLAKAGIKTEFEVRIGSTGNEIIEVEEEIHPDLVAMSTHGHSGFGRFEHGSITDKVLHAGKTPLLLVRPRAA